VFLGPQLRKRIYHENPCEAVRFFVKAVIVSAPSMIPVSIHSTSQLMWRLMELMLHIWYARSNLKPLGKQPSMNFTYSLIYCV